MTTRFKARRLEDGLPEWRASGLPVVIGKTADPRLNK
jgi:hypothetical protein